MTPKFLSLLGGLILFGSWVTQTTLYERWNNKVASLDRAESLYIVTLSSVFVIESVPNREGDMEYGLFRLGLDYMVRGLPENTQKEWQEKLLRTGDKELNDFGSQLMDFIDRDKATLEAWKTNFLAIFMSLYIVGSALIILGQYLELRDNRKG
jgi:hypothetical protein